MYSFHALNVMTSAGYLTMTFPIYRPLLQSLDPGGEIIGVGVSSPEQPVGLALAKILSDTNSEILSLYVSRPHRGRGIGSSLLLNMEDALLDRGCTRAELVYAAGKPATAALESMLNKCGWALTQPRMLLCKIGTEIVNAPWVKELVLPPSFTMVPWSDITEEERMVIQLRQEAQKWIPDNLVPFQYEQNMEPINSLGLRFDGQIVGWILTHRIAPDTIRYTALFVHKEFPKARALALLAEAVNRQFATLGRNSYGTFSVAVGNTTMVKFVARRLAPYLISRLETRGTFKLLSKSESDRASAMTAIC
jgi:GNAT superfamily N-acetyltransferase